MTDMITGSATVLIGDVRERISSIPEKSVQCVVTSPPYYGLRDYGHDGQIGLEQTPQAYVDEMVAVFREVRRVLADDGTLWLNIGDSYSSGGERQTGRNDANRDTPGGRGGSFRGGSVLGTGILDGGKPKDLLGIPWRVALALQDDGWYLRQDIIWSKPNPMPESVKDRCTKSHEYLFLLTKSPRYYYNAEAIREPHASAYSKDVLAKGEPGDHRPRGNNFSKEARLHEGITTPRTRAERAALLHPLGRNRRSVWTIATQPYKEAHFAVFPQQLVEPCILAGSGEGDTVFDPFAGSGTTLEVAQRLGRKALGIELNPEYMPLIRKRLAQQPLVLEATP